MSATRYVTPNRSLVATRPGDSSVLALHNRPLGEPGPDQLLVRVEASGVNFVEIYQREGRYSVPLDYPLGSEGAGRVVAAGSAVAGFAVGDRVAWLRAPGSHSDYVMVAADAAIPVPDALSGEPAAAALLQGVTAHYLVNSTYPVQRDDSVLVHAAAGGVGQLLVQLAKAAGAHVVATASSAAKLATATARGADAVVNYRDHEGTAQLVRALRAANGGAGFSVVFDGVGRDTFDASLASLGRRGMLVLFGAASGAVDPLDPQILARHGSVYLTRPGLTDYVATREELLWRATEVLSAVARGSLTVEIGGRYPLDDAARAYDDLQGRRTTGKLLLTR